MITEKEADKYLEGLRKRVGDLLSKAKYNEFTLLQALEGALLANECNDYEGKHHFLKYVEIGLDGFDPDLHG